MTRFLPTSLRSQLILVLLGAVIITQFLSICLFVDERRNAIITSTAFDATSRVMSVAQGLETQPAFIHPIILRATQSDGFGVYISDNPPVSESNSEFLNMLKKRNVEKFGILANQPLVFSLREAPATGILQNVARTTYPHGELTVSYMLSDGRWANAVASVHEMPFIWAWRAFLVLALMSLTMIGVVWYLIARVSKPLRQLAQASTRIGNLQKTSTLPLSGPDELLPLTEAFNEMTKRLKHVLREKSQMLAAIGHDLRSPITAMRLRTEMLPDDANKERISICLDEIETLVQGALLLARSTDSGEETAEFELDSLIHELVDECHDLNEDVDVQSLSPITILGRRASLKRAVRNIINNAVRYGKFARIALTQEKNNLLLRIYDGGPGIPQQEHERIFEPFVRLEPSRCKLTGGTGLGLTIAKSVIANHNGRIFFETDQNGQFCTIISLPLDLMVKKRPPLTTRKLQLAG